MGFGDFTTFKAQFDMQISPQERIRKYWVLQRGLEEAPILLPVQAGGS